ncbi:MAG: hypothetical protein ACO2PN_12090 [Pyrobaculum sp.]
MRSNANYVVYIATADLLKLAEKDDAVRRAVVLCLAEMAKNGTPRWRGVAEKSYRGALFKPWLADPSKPIIVPSRRIKPPHATRELRQNIERSRDGGAGGI